MELFERPSNLFLKVQNIKAHFHFLRFIKNPLDTEEIFKMAKSFQSSADQDMIQRVMGPVLRNTCLKSDFENKVWYTHPSMKTLSTYPAGSFGKHVADFFEKNHLDENLFPQPDFSSVINYITSRVYQTHDFWHVLTGYSIHLEDEMALQAFAVGQYKQPISMTIIAGGIIHILQKNPERSFFIMNSITQGYERGLKAKFLLEINIFKYLDRPLKEVQEMLNIQPLQAPDLSWFQEKANRVDHHAS